MISLVPSNFIQKGKLVVFDVKSGPKSHAYSNPSFSIVAHQVLPTKVCRQLMHVTIARSAIWLEISISLRSRNVSINRPSSMYVMSGWGLSGCGLGTRLLHTGKSGVATTVIGSEVRKFSVACYCSEEGASGQLRSFLERNFFQELLHHRYLPTPDMYQVYSHTWP